MGRTVVITGATRGVGRTTAELFSRKGWTVVGLARSSADDFPGELIRVNLLDLAETREVAADIASRYDVDACVNNASHGLRASFESSHVEDIDDLLKVNVHAPIILTQAFVPGMRERSWGRIVNVSSVSAAGVPRLTLYGTAKGALDTFTLCLASEVASEGITVNAIAIGPTETALFQHHNPPGSASRARWLEVIPAGRFGTCEEIAAGIDFLSGEMSGYITGQILRADGGATLVGAVGARSDGGLYSRSGPSTNFAGSSI